MGRLSRSIFILGDIMKTILKRIVPFILSVEILVTSFFTCSVPVYAADFMPHDIVQAVEYGIEYNDWDPFWRFLNDSKDGLMYLYSQMGAFVTQNFQAWVDNNKALESLVETVPVPAKKEDNNIVFTKEFMAQLKALLDDYAKQNEPYWIVPIASYRDLDPAKFKTKAQYSTICQLARTYGLIGVNGDQISDLSGAIENKHSLVMYTNWADTPDWSKEHALVCFYNEAWQWRGYYIYRFNFTSDMTVGFTSFDDGTKLDASFSRVTLHDRFFPNYPFYHNGGLYDYNGDIYSAPKACLISKDGGHMRVYKTLDDFKRYTVGNRKVYYTENYYNYVPEDLQVSIDDLQKTIDDMQDVIDKLLDQITNDTSESEIEELLRRILEALENNPGGGGGGGSGGGDVNVDIDLSSTNSLLSKILAKITQIYDKMNTAVGDAEQAAFTKIQESLDEIVEQLEKIKRWTAIDTVIDGVDAVADWLDLIRGVLKDAKEGAGSAVAALSSAVGGSVDLMSKKFPFSIPWDVLFFVSVLSAEPQMPHFEIPFNIESSMLGITIDYTMELDFSQFQWLSDLSRLIFSMIYAVGLMKMTFGVTSVGKEE